MNLRDNEIQMSEFYSLMGYFSDKYQSKVSAIFVGFTNQNITYFLRNYHINYSEKKLVTQPGDYSSFTLCVQFENKQVEGVRNLVENELHNLQFLAEKVKLLDYMRHSDA
jgi:imidazoleglycerol phosphate synthase glutamine amidotransferase subunit HisH